MPETNEHILTVDIDDKMKSAYLDYSMSVIISRALPDVRDGLKPVHRRVLTAMNDLNLAPNRPYRKSAKITGDTTGNYHPHGTTAVYDTLVRMAQDFSLRYPLVDGQGNFGSIDGDSPAAERYTEARLAPIAMEMLRDLDKDTVDFVPNYDGSREMPSVLPSAIPNLLINGSTGIAVGMATNCPPHNLREVVDGLVALLEDPEMDAVRLLDYVQGPDFPTGGIVYGRQGIIDYIARGRGRVVMRARTEFEERPNGRDAIIVTEIPYFVNKSELIQKIAQQVRDGVIEGIGDLADESDRDGMRIVILLKKDAHREVVLNQLFKHTQMQTTFGVNNIALVGTQPRVLSLKEMMEEYLKFREEVIVRRTRFELRKAEERAHILEGYRIALENIDEVVELIKKSPDGPTARQRLMERFGLSEVQAQAILDLRLQRLTGLERDKIEKEYLELIQQIERLRSILQSRDMQIAIIKEELLDVRERFGDERRTEILDDLGDLSMEDLIPEEDMVVTISHAQYAKRLPVDTYRIQGRGGRGVTGASLKEEDWVEHLFVANTHQYLLVFTSTGRCHWLKVHQIPQAGRAAKGKAIVNLLQLEKEESVRAIVPVPGGFDEDKYVFFVTRAGLVRRTALSQFSNIRRSGIRAIEVVEGDQLMDAALTDGSNHVILAVRSGKSIRFDENDVRPMGRTARGVKGIELSSADDRVVGMIVVQPGDDEVSVLSVTENGYGKRTPLEEYRVQGRGGKGIITMNITHRNGPLVGVQAARPQEELMVITRNGIVIRMAMDSISTMGRNTQGVKLINLGPEDAVATVAPVASSAELETMAGEDEPESPA